MAKDAQGKPPDTSPVADRWKPTRAIGLARALMKAGYGTRKQTTAMVTAGRITIDEEIVKDPGRTVEPGTQIYLDGEPLTRLRHSYYAFNKPVRVACSPSNGPERRLVSDFYPAKVPGLQSAGRMDARTVGLLLVSNDRRWNNLVTGSKTLDQEFRIQVEGELTDLEISVMTAGVRLPNLGLFRPQEVKVVEVLNGRTVMTMVVRQGKVRQVRRMMATLRHKVVFLRRIRIGDIRLGDLPAGGIRHLTAGEIHSIFDMEKTGSKPTRKVDG
jgi:pseudouridine synthase